MATKTVRVSDLSGQQIPDDDQGARLIVEHPNYQEPIGLDVVPDEVQQHLSDENSRFVVVFLQTADTPNPQRYILSFEEFVRIFQTGNAQQVLEEAYTTQQTERETQSQRRGRGRRAVASALGNELITPVRNMPASRTEGPFLRLRRNTLGTTWKK